MSDLLTPEQANGTPEPAHTGEHFDRPSDAFDESWLGSLLRPVLIVLMVLCINLALDVFLRQYAPGLGDAMRWTMLGLGLVAAVLGVVTTSWLAHPSQRLQRSAGYRAAEIILLLLIARLALWVAQGTLPSVEAFLYRPDEVFFDGPYLLTLLAVLCTWFAAIDFTGDMMELALQPDELRMAAQRQYGADTSRPAQTDRSSVLRRFVARWVGWGVLLLAIASALRLGVTRAQFWTLARQDVDLSVVAVVVLYFICGLLLISQGQLAVLRGRWMRDKLPTAPSVLRNWPVYTLVVLLAIGGLATLLPLGDTMPISLVLGWLLDAMYFLVSLIFQLISLLLILLFALLPAGAPPAMPEPPPPQAIDPPTPLPPLVIPPWINGLLFWSTIAFILFVAAYFYFADRNTNFRWLRAILAALQARWRQLWGAWQGWRQSVLGGSRAGDKAAGGALAGLRKLLPQRWGGLSPEQRVRFLYFQLLEEAAEHDKPRLPGETPAAYAPRLAAAVAEEQAAPPVPGNTGEIQTGYNGGTQSGRGELNPTEEPAPGGEPAQPVAVEPTATSPTETRPTETRPTETQPTETQPTVAQAEMVAQAETVAAIRTLTDAFVQVRYAGEPVEEAQVSWLRQVWERLRRRFG